MAEILGETVLKYCSLGSQGNAMISIPVVFQKSHVLVMQTECHSLVTQTQTNTIFFQALTLCFVNDHSRGTALLFHTPTCATPHSAEDTGDVRAVKLW